MIWCSIIESHFEKTGKSNKERHAHLFEPFPESPVSPVFCVYGGIMREIPPFLPPFGIRCAVILFFFSFSRSPP
jgi:hypothetical protein